MPSKHITTNRSPLWQTWKECKHMQKVGPHVSMEVESTVGRSLVVNVTVYRTSVKSSKTLSLRVPRRQTHFVMREYFIGRTCCVTECG